MHQTLFHLPLATKRDALLARQRARQVASLLGYDFHDQACIAAGVFAIACQVLSLGAPMRLCFSVANDCFHVFVSGRAAKLQNSPHELSLFRLEKGIPSRCKLSGEDLVWAVKQLDQLVPVSTFDEIYHVNQELLATIHALKMCQAELAEIKNEKSSAA